MSANSSDLLDADQPIPLGRPAVPESAAVVSEPEVVPAMASTTPAAVGALPAGPTTQPPGHRMAGLRGFRLEPVRVEPLYSGRRDLVRFLVQFALVMAFVYALIVAFVLLVAHVKGTPA